MEDPFVAHETAARLSLAIHSVRSWTERCCARTSLCAIVAVSSRSDMDKVPCGQSAVIRAAQMCGGNGWRQTMGDVVGLMTSNQTPPIPVRRLSQAPMSEGEPEPALEDVLWTERQATMPST